VIQNRDEKLRLSAKGKTELEHIIAKMRSEAPFRDQKWKGGWWIFAFDVPEIHRGARDAMRLILKRAGFLQLQQSVWVHPFECEELRELLCEDPRLEGRVIYARVDKLNNEVRLLAHFGLQRKP
jgi:DNA-binding transcriptional regulator PaaX